MGFPVTLALRYLGSKKRASISVGTAFAMLGVTLGVAALAMAMSVTGGFQEQFREKVLGVNAHVLVLKYSIDFREYRDVMQKVAKVKGVIGTAPFVINPMMVTHGDRTATGVLLKGVDPELMPKVLDLPKHIREGSLDGLRKAGAKPPAKGGNDPFRVSPSATHTSLEHDAGTRSSLLLAIERQIQEDDERAKHTDAGAPRGEDADDVRLSGQHDDADGVPKLSGAVTPDGGFASKLPDEDVLPDSIDPDPCRSPELVAKLPGVVIGRSLSKQLALTIGDCAQITSPTIGMSYGGSGRLPIAKQFRVIAIFEAGFDQYDSKLVYTDLYEAQAFYEYGDSVTGVEMKVDDIDHARAINKQVDQLLSNSIYHTMDWQELNHGLFTALLIQQIGMSVVLALIIVVAAFTVIATLIMVVLDKRKEIALLKAIGAKDTEVLRVFLYQGAIIGLVGTIAGLVVGFFGCKALVAWGFPLDPKVYFISALPVRVRPQEFAITGAFAVLTCLVATFFPAMYAARLRPSDGLRSE